MTARRVCVLVLVTYIGALSTDALHAQSSPITYVYDPLGRLVGVVDGTGESAVYVYDAVGNLLSIERHSSATVSIIQFTPSSGAIGASVTIYGTAFSATPSQNTVTFNGTAATVTSSTTTQLVATVPAGATSGTIAVTTPIGSAAGTTSFVVGTPGQPTISSFTPQIGVAGTAVTISGTNFDTTPTNNRAKFNGKSSTPSSATSSSLVTAVPTQIGSGRITIATPAGLATGGDFFVPPSPYTAADVSNTGRATLGSATSISMTTASKIALVGFDSPPGQRVSLRVSNVSIPWSQVSIMKPDNTALVPPTWVSTNGKFFDTQTFSALGSYTIVVDPDSTNTGNITLTAYDVPADVSATISAGGSAVTVTPTTPGQNARLTFTGSANQRVSLRLTNVSIPWSQVSITKPDTTTLVAPTWVSSSGKFVDTQTLPVAGTYAIFLNPDEADTGNATLTLYEVPADASGTITAGGSPVSLTVSVPGQNPYVTFSGTANQQVRLNVTGVTIPWSLVSVTKPDGTALISPTWVSTNGKLFDTQTLPVTGTYKIIIDPELSNTGNVTLTLSNIP
jgi:YD repeat-containing protein